MFEKTQLWLDPLYYCGVNLPAGNTNQTNDKESKLQVRSSLTLTNWVWPKGTKQHTPIIVLVPHLFLVLLPRLLPPAAFAGSALHHKCTGETGREVQGAGWQNNLSGKCENKISSYPEQPRSFEKDDNTCLFLKLFRRCDFC